MGRNSNTKILLIIAVFVLGIYVLPSAVAKYAGSHTWEFNGTGRVTALQCGKCHTYIKTEINSSITTDVVTAHTNASATAAYVGPGSIINITNTPTGSLDDVCWMCHVQENDVTVGGGHTKVVIRVCTDSDCHGDEAAATSGGFWDTDKMNVTGLIRNDADAHKNFYRPLDAVNSTYGNEDGGVYTQGFITCLACHTHVGLDLNLTRPQKLSLAMNLTNVTDPNGWTLVSLTVNYTNMTSTVGGKEPGSVWS